MVQIETGEMYPTYWSKLQKIEGNIYGKWTYVKGDIPSTRYVILFNLYTNYQKSFSKSLYDSKEECFAECDELDELYKNHPLPVIKELKWNGVYPKKRHEYPIYDYDDKSWWGYIVLDFKLKEIIRIGGHGFKTVKSFKINPQKSYTGIFKIKGANIPECRDYFFRDVDEVPDNYKWDQNEYEGWLQFKWGDGKNAVNYVEPPKSKKTKEIQKLKEDTSDLDLENEYENYEADLLEDKFADLLDKETRKQLMEKYGW